eukprot:1184339-Prorocentrum_minimum.AAC.3
MFFFSPGLTLPRNFEATKSFFFLSKRDVERLRRSINVDRTAVITTPTQPVGLSSADPCPSHERWPSWGPSDWVAPIEWSGRNTLHRPEAPHHRADCPAFGSGGPVTLGERRESPLSIHRRQGCQEGVRRGSGGGQEGIRR